MVTALLPFYQRSEDANVMILGRYYGASADRPISKRILTQKSAGRRFPHLRILMKQHNLQPRIHDGVVTVICRGVVTRFHIFVKNHVNLTQNRVVWRWGNRSWKGDIVVMRKGLVCELVNMRTGDAELANFAVKKFIQNVKQKARFTIPKVLVFKK